MQAQNGNEAIERLEIHYTPKNGSWLNIAEIELSDDEDFRGPGGIVRLVASELKARKFAGVVRIKLSAEATDEDGAWLAQQLRASEEDLEFTIRINELSRRLRERGAEVQVVLTAGAQQFVTPLTFQALSGRPVRSDLWDEAAAAEDDAADLAQETFVRVYFERFPGVRKYLDETRRLAAERGYVDFQLDRDTLIVDPTRGKAMIQLDIREGDELDEKQFTKWVEQASKLPGEKL